MFNWLSNIVIGTGSYNVMPLKCLRHEFGHPLFGDNTFHTAGEQARFTYDYWLDVPGGYSVMGLHGSSLMTWNGWDRQRMDWRPIGNAFNPSARNSTSSSEVDGDIDPINTSQAGDYILRDFATTGDALRIKIPFLNPSLEFPEFLWIENHQGALNNGIVFDQFQYQDQSCVTPFVP